MHAENGSHPSQHMLWRLGAAPVTGGSQFLLRDDT